MQTVPEVDRIVNRLRSLGGESISLTSRDAAWLVSEIDGGREAFEVLCQQKKALEQKLLQQQCLIDDLSATVRAKR